MLSATELAHSANGAGICTSGATSMLATVLLNTELPSSADFAPVEVRCRHSYEAAGVAKPDNSNNLNQELYESRLIYRSIRNLFPADYKHKIELSCNMLAYDSINRSEVLSINSASLALAISDVPWNGPVGAVR